MGFFWQFGGAIFKTFAQLGILFILARLISKAEFGIVQSALVVVGLSQLLSQMGVGPALVQKVNLTPTHIKVGSTISLGLGLTFFLIVYSSSGLIASFFKMPELQSVLKVIAFIFIIEGITTVSQSLLLRQMEQKTLIQINFFSYLVGYGIVAVLLAYYGYGIWSLIIGQIALSFLKSILSYLKCKHSVMPSFSRKEAKELLHYGGGFTLAKLFNFFALEGDNVITGRYLGAEALGVYSRAYSIMVRPVSLIGDSIDAALFPAMAAKQDEPDRLIEAFINGSKLISFLCIPIASVIIFSSKEIIHVLLGSEWGDTVLPLQILTAGLLFRMGYKMGDCLTKATGNVYSRAKRQFLYALGVILGCYAGSHWGIVGVAFGTLFSVLLNYILMIHLSLNILKINWAYFLKRSFSDLYVALLLSLLFVAIIYFVRQIAISEFLILLLSYGFYGICLMTLFYFYAHKLSFLEVLPFKRILNKITRQS